MNHKFGHMVRNKTEKLWYKIKLACLEEQHIRLVISDFVLTVERWVSFNIIAYLYNLVPDYIT